MKITKSFLFDEGRYFKSCHASTVLPIGSEALVACFGGDFEGADNTRIWVTRAGSEAMPVCISGGENIAHYNPVLFKLSGDTIALYFKMGDISKESRVNGVMIQSWLTYVCYSHDDGATWSAPERLVADGADGHGPVKNKPLRLSNGDIITPCSTESHDTWTVIPDVSTDNGRTWHITHAIDCEAPYSVDVSGMIQPALWESASGHVHMLTRTPYGRMFRSDSADYGRTWSVARGVDIPNNNAGFDLDKTADGALYLVYNPVSENWGKRTPLVVGRSVDNGNTFDTIAALEEDDGEYSYPSIVAVGNMLHITYTWQRRNIVYATVAL